tara:strand:- start:1623 stop:1964 length:342 start_codon:yes stop_codon:yes gene_type:complete
MRITKTMLIEVCLGLVALLAVCLVLAWASQGVSRKQIQDHTERMVEPIVPELVAPQEPIGNDVNKKNKISPDSTSADLGGNDTQAEKTFKNSTRRVGILRRMLYRRSRATITE